MSHHFNSAQLRLLNNDISSIASTWGQALDSIITAAENLAGSDHIRGEGAQALSTYFTHVHATTLAKPLQLLVVDLTSAFRDYYAAYLALDGDKDAVIDTAELEAIKAAIDKLKAGIIGSGGTAAEMTRVMNTISDISAQTYASPATALESACQACTNKLDDIISAIGENETTGVAGVKAISEAIVSLRNLIRSFGSSSYDITAYTPADLTNNKDFSALSATMETVNANLDALRKNSEQTEALLADVEKQWEEQAKKAELFKTGLAVLEGLVFVAAIACAGPLGVIGAAAVCGAAGFANASISEGLDQWGSGSASANGTDWGACTIEGIKGGVKGAIKGAVGATFAHVTPGPNASLMDKFITKGATNFASNMIDEGSDLLISAFEGDFFETLEEKTSVEHSLEFVGSCVIDTAFSVGGDAVGKGIGKALPETLSDSKVWSTAGGVAKDFVVETAKDTGTAFLEDGVQTNSNGQVTLDFASASQGAIDELTDGRKYINRFVSATVENTSSALTENAFDNKFDQDVDAQRETELTYYENVIDNADSIEVRYESVEVEIETQDYYIYGYEESIEVDIELKEGKTFQGIRDETWDTARKKYQTTEKSWNKSAAKATTSLASGDSIDAGTLHDRPEQYARQNMMDVVTGKVQYQSIQTGSPKP